MIRIQYDYGYLMDEGLYVRKGKDEDPFEYYDKKDQKWVSDWSLSEIYTGDVRYKPMSKEEVWTALNLQE